MKSHSEKRHYFPFIHHYSDYRPISQTVFMLLIAINRAEHVCATVIIKHNYMPMCNQNVVINRMVCRVLNSDRHNHVEIYTSPSNCATLSCTPVSNERSDHNNVVKSVYKF